MTMLLCGASRMMQMRSVHGMGYFRGGQTSDVNGFANRMIQKCDNVGDGVSSADELGKFNERLGLVEDNFNENGLINHEKIISRSSERLEERSKEWAGVNNGVEIQPPSVNAVKVDSLDPIFKEGTDEDLPLPNHPPIDQIPPAPMPTPKEAYPDDTDILNDSDTQTAGVTSEIQSLADFVKQRLSQLNLSEENFKSFLKTMQNYRVNVTA